MCTSPLVRLVIPNDKVYNKFKKIGQRGLEETTYIFHPLSSDLHSILSEYSQYNGGEFPFTYQTIPCGQCEDCRIKRSKEWAQRIILESQQYEHNWFLTLTYNDDNLINNVEWSVSRLDGELGFTPFLNKDDFTAFKKRLLSRMRDKYGYTGIRFFECGEYGSKNGRPHFHAIFFNLPIPDLELVKNVSLGGKQYSYYHSKMIDECWSKGYVMIGEVSWESAAYVARYVVKKFKGEDAKAYSAICAAADVPEQPPEFINMSRRPGIARKYYDEEHQEFYKNDNIVLPNGRNVQPCRYFDKLFDLEHPEEMQNIKEERQRLAAFKEMNKFKGSTVDNFQEFKQKEQAAKERARKKLVRPL